MSQSSELRSSTATTGVAVRLFSVGRKAAALLGLTLMAATSQAHFTDDFNRADSATIGNGWIEKSAAAFSLAGNEASKVAAGGSDYRNNIVYRPANEDSLNHEATVELRLTGLPVGYPQVLVRAQSATAATNNTLDAYLLYLGNSPTQAVLARQRGSNWDTQLATIAIAPALNTVDRYRLRLSAVGTTTVQLSAFIERFNGTAWDTIGQAQVNDSSGERIAAAGSVGFGGFIETNYRYDNFTRIDLGATGTTNAAPTTTGVAPSVANAGESGLTLVVYGGGFSTDSIVRWNGSNRVTAYVSPSEVEAQITAADLASAGSYNVTVFNPTPGGGTSSARTFLVNPAAGPPAPAIISLSPANAIAGGAQFTMTVNGTNFSADSVVRWNGTNRATAYVSVSQLQATISAADIAAAGTSSVTVLRQSDSSVSAAANFVISNPPAPGSFADNFNRADSATIGNGWIEKSAAAFSIAGNEAAKVAAGGSDYRNNIVYRPASEDILDSEASVELRFLSLPAGYPQVMTRVQSATAATTNVLDAYMLYIADSPTRAILSRQRGGNFDTQLAAITLTTALNTVDRFRLRLRATGSAPVQLNAFVERLNGATWQIIGQASLNDSSADRLGIAGSVGFAGYIETNYRYDNFTRTDLGTPNPVPALTSLAPSSATAGAAATNVTVTGANFVPASVGRWNGADRTTTYLSATQLTIQLTPADLASAGTGTLTVFNPSPGGGSSGGLTFAVNAPAANPVPAATSLAPTSANAGSAGFTMTVTGSNFVSGSIVRWNGSNRTTIFVSSTQLQAQISAGDIASAGTVNVTVFSPSPGGGTSGSLSFQINAVNNPSPVASSINPASATAGSAAFTLTINGSNFVAGSVVRWNGNNRTTTFVSASQLQAQITTTDVAAAGTAAVSVFNPAPGGGTSGSVTFQINTATNPVPTLAALNPTGTSAGSGAFTLTVTGTGFMAGSTVQWAGANRTTTYVSATQLQAQILATDVATTGSRNITVTSPAPGGGTSNSIAFNVSSGTSPVPVLNTMAPMAAPPGSGAFTLTVNGTGFTNASVVRWNGSNRNTVFVSAAQLRADITSADVALAGLGTVTVSTPAPGGGTSTPLTFFLQDGSLTYFFDGFNRANSATIGNNWTEKNPAAFSVQNNQVVSFDTASGFVQDIMYRQSSEDRLDVETAVEFDRLPYENFLQEANFPQVHARIQRSTVTQNMSLDSYIFFIDDVSGNGMIAVTRAPTPGERWECYIAAVPLTETTVVGQRYRLRFRVSGTAPVQLNGTIERFANGSWVAIGNGSATHDTTTQRDPSLYCDQPTLPQPIVSAGATGLAKWTNRTDNYDNFYWRDLTGGPIPPIATGLSPTSVVASSGAFQLAVAGSSFAPDSIVWWNGVARPTTYMSSTSLVASIAAGDIATPGVASIVVQSVSTGLASNPLQMQVFPATSTVIVTDNFNRTDGANIGNGWIEKNAGAFSLVSGRAQKLSTPGGDYRNNLLYRPSAEDALNTEASVELRLQSLSVGFPQLFARLQSASAATSGGFTGYLLYVNDSVNSVTLARQLGTGYDQPLTTMSLATPLNVTDTYRLRLQVTGTNPVRLTAFVERLNGASWEVLAQRTVDDTSAQRIQTAGSAGFGGYVENTYSFDNFTYTNLAQ